MAARLDMSDQLLLLLIGFVLTTVAGGFLGYWFQSRAWRSQEHARLSQAEREAAKAFFEDLSRVFDRRLHRMRELDAWLSRARAEDEVERSLGRYREAVDDWNDNLNRMLALAQRYFGQELRDNLDYELMRRFVEAGKRLEERVREYRNTGESLSASLTSDLDSLAHEVYFLNVQLIEAIQRGAVGIFHPDVDTERQAR
jgi:hypothetical protein